MWSSARPNSDVKSCSSARSEACSSGGAGLAGDDDGVAHGSRVRSGITKYVTAALRRDPEHGDREPRPARRAAAAAARSRLGVGDEREQRGSAARTRAPGRSRRARRTAGRGERFAREAIEPADAKRRDPRLIPGRIRDDGVALVVGASVQSIQPRAPSPQRRRSAAPPARARDSARPGRERGAAPAIRSDEPRARAEQHRGGFFGGPLALERPLAGDPLVQDHAERPDVGGAVDGAAVDLLRRHVADRADRRAGIGVASHAVAPREPEIITVTLPSGDAIAFSGLRSRCTKPAACSARPRRRPAARAATPPPAQRSPAARARSSNRRAAAARGTGRARRRSRDRAA